jgi:hypothetical protein
MNNSPYENLPLEPNDFSTFFFAPDDVPAVTPVEQDEQRDTEGFVVPPLTQDGSSNFDLFNSDTSSKPHVRHTIADADQSRQGDIPSLLASDRISFLHI